jgi:hypothetical protein
MSKLEVDAIEPQSGTTLTIGASGDTVNIASGATITDFTSTGIDDNATSTAITINSSEQVEFTAGTVSLPSITTTGDTNTGIFFPAADTIAFTEGGVEAMRIISNGAVGIGTSSPDAPLDIRATNSSIRLGNASQYFRIQHNDSANALVFNDNDISERMRIDSSGNVGIGTTAPDAKLSVNGVASFGDGTALLPSIANFGDLNTGMWFPAADTIAFSEGGTEAMRINSSGQVGIGSTNPNRTLVLDATSGSNFELKRSPNSGGLYFETDGTDGVMRSVGATGSLIFQTNGTNERMRITSSGNVGIGTSSPESLFHIESASSDPTLRITNKTVAAIDTGPDIEFWNNPFTATTVNSYESGAIRVRKTNGSNNNHDHYMSFWTRQNSPEGINERMRITSSGDVFIAKTGTAIGTVGIELDSTGSGAFTTSAVPVLYVNRLTDDGDLIRFFQASTEEGSISVSGGTVSYNGFTGTHWSRFTDNSTPNILRGTVLETLDEMCDWYNLEFDVINQDDEGNDVTTTEKVPHVLTDTQSIGDTVTYNHEGTDVQATIVKETDIKHMMSKVSDTVDAKNVYGVFVAYDNDGDGYNDFYVASVGSYVVRIKSGETLAKGDLLQSNGDGTAKVQSDDNIKSSSFAKVLSTTIIETYEDGSYLVPCSLMC